MSIAIGTFIELPGYNFKTFPVKQSPGTATTTPLPASATAAATSI